MKKRFTAIVLATALMLPAGAALAESIKGRIGATAKIGFVNYSDSELGDFRIKPDVGIIGGGNILYGIDDNLTAEIDVTRSAFSSDFPRSGNAGDFGVTDIALGGQYRFAVTNPKLVPYVGVGLDILVTDYEHFDVDTTVGVHASGGIDYFLYRQMALTAELRAVLAPETDIRNRTGKQGNFDPSNVSTTFGVRVFF